MMDLNMKYNTVKCYSEGNPQTVELSNDSHKTNSDKSDFTKISKYFA